ncbi:MAG: MerR family transcriptional regulator, partial [Myxococcota bacterium]
MGASAVVSEAPTEELLRVGDLARACGKTVRAIHHYENLGLLQPVRRSKGRYRLYAPDAVDRVRWIGKLNDVGMSLSEIHEVLSRWEQGPSAPEAMSKVRQVYRDKLAEVSRQIQHLESLAHELQA